MTPREWVAMKQGELDPTPIAIRGKHFPNEAIAEGRRVLAVLEAAVAVGPESCERVVARGATSYVRNPLGACDGEDPHMCPPCRIRAAVAALPGEDAP